MEENISGEQTILLVSWQLFYDFWAKQWLIWIDVSVMVDGEGISKDKR